MNNRSKIMGFTRLKNKVSRNAFDKTRRHMFTAQIGELLPIFCEWVNPNETFHFGYDGMSRTAPLNTAAFTRLRENVQFFFVPFYSLWRFFPEVYSNMKVGAAGQNISSVAASATNALQLSTAMPYINYNSLLSYCSSVISESVYVLTSFISTNKFGRNNIPSLTDFEPVLSKGIQRFGTYRYVRAGKLFMALGYGDFSQVVTYDLVANIIEYLKTVDTFDAAKFRASKYYLNVKLSPNVSNVPNLSIFPLLAYHKICNDHYRALQWQPFNPTICNIDYISPTSNMDMATSFSSDLGGNTVYSLLDTIFETEQSNLPLDYLLGVLPVAQYGNESVAPVGLSPAYPDGTPALTASDHLPHSSRIACASLL